MATPIGHAFAACGIWLASGSRDRGLRLRGLALCAVFAIAPDFDFLPGLLVGNPGLYHQGLSHSLGVLVPVALLGALVFPWPAPTLFRRAAVLGLAYGSHLAMDLVGPDRKPPLGIPLLWPFTDRPFLSPRAVFLGVRHSPDLVTPTADWLNNIFSVQNAMAVGVELVVVAPFVLLGLLYRRSRSRG